jgi:hypothetical protein
MRHYTKRRYKRLGKCQLCKQDDFINDDQICMTCKRSKKYKNMVAKENLNQKRVN